MTVLVVHVEDEGLLHEIAFEVDPFFGTKLAYAADRLFQTFLTKFMDMPTVAQVDPSFYDISFITSMA